MVCNVHHLSPGGLVTPRYHIRKVSLVYLDVHTKSSTESHNLHVIPVSTSPRHLLQMTLEDSVDFCRSWRGVSYRCRVCSSILSLWISSDATARVHVDELLVHVSMLPHVVDDTGPDFMVGGLSAVELVRKGMKETVACNHKSKSVP